MKCRVIQSCSANKRSLVLSGDRYGLVMKFYKEGEELDLDESKIWAMPSVLFGIACLYETDLQTAIDNLSNTDKKWSY